MFFPEAAMKRSGQYSCVRSSVKELVVWRLGQTLHQSPESGPRDLIPSALQTENGPLGVFMSWLAHVTRHLQPVPSITDISKRHLNTYHMIMVYDTLFAIIIQYKYHN